MVTIKNTCWQLTKHLWFALQSKRWERKELVSWCFHYMFPVHSQYSQSVWQAPDPSLGQNRVSTFFLPSWSCWGSGSSARQVYLNLCSCLDPSWLTLTGIQGVQGVLRRTSGQASRLQTLYSWKTEWRNLITINADETSKPSYYCGFSFPPKAIGSHWFSNSPSTACRDTLLPYYILLNNLNIAVLSGWTLLCS